MTALAGQYRVESWLDEHDIAEVEYSAYWNDSGVEAEKEVFDVRSGGCERMERYLEAAGLVDDLEQCLAELRSRDRVLRGRGVDLAAGTAWAVPRLLAEGVEEMVAVEYSRQRLTQQAPVVLEHYGVSPAKVTLALGSFYELDLPDSSVDLGFMCQAFHHADDPDRLLAELRRVLRDDGIVLIIGEHAVSRVDGARARLRHAAKAGLGRTRRTLRPEPHELFPPDPVLGDHLYEHRAYRKLFAAHGFSARRLARPGSHYQGFILELR